MKKILQYIFYYLLSYQRFQSDLYDYENYITLRPRL